MAADLDGRLRAEGLDPGRWSNGPGDRYAAHDHGYDKVIVVERGSIRFGLGSGAAVELAEGDRLELPAGTAARRARRAGRSRLPRGAQACRLAPLWSAPPGRDVVTATRSRPG